MLRVRRATAQALVESALVLPLLVVVCLGVLQVVLYAHAHNVLLSAVQEAARLAAEDGRGLDDGYARVQSLVVAGLGSSADPLRVAGQRDDEVVVFRIDAALRPILPLPMIRDLPLRAEGRVARERFRPAGARP